MNLVNPMSDFEEIPGHSVEPAVLARLANLIKGIGLDCECRSRLDETLSRFSALESRRAAREYLADARSRRERIETLLQFLTDLEQLKATERDRSVYLDIALLFDDIAGTAKEGAVFMRQLSRCPEQEPL